MAGPGFMKRQKELKRQEKNQEKAIRKADRQKTKDSGAPLKEGEDPDLAGMVVGPQPPPEE